MLAVAVLVLWPFSGGLVRWYATRSVTSMQMGVEVHLHRVRLPEGHARAANALCSVKRRWDFVGGTQF